MPTLPPGGVVPNLPGGVAPPIATLPPEGMMPTLPGQPGGVMPTLPGGVVPPIATLPPEGMMPTLPGQPGGVMPTLPGRLLPNLPGGVAPPIATLPPEGMMPTLPGQPGGVMPNLPGGVVPPIATLPPGAGLLPTVPGQVVPPIATLVPPGEVTPAVPTSPQPGGVLPRGPRLPAAPAENTTAEREGIARPEARCIERGSEQATAENQKKLPLCEDLRARMAPATNEAPNAEVPLTAGRDLIPPTLWNVWALTEGTSVSDHRYGLDNNSLAGTLTMGLDRKITDDVVLGVSVAVDKSRNELFGDSLRTDTNGFSIGPYLAVRLSPHWAIDTSLSYGHTNSDLRLLGLSGNFASQQYEASANLNGQYDIGEAYARPKLSVTYSRNISDSYSLAGSILGRPINVGLADSAFNYGVIDATTEIGRLFSLSNGTQLMPYAEFGVHYEFERPNGGQILTGDLTMATPSPWTASVRTGMRALLTNNAQIEASVGYLSFGQNGLNVWDGQLRLSIGF